MQLPGTSSAPTLVPPPFGVPAPIDETRVASIMRDMIETTDKLIPLLQAQQGVGALGAPATGAAGSAPASAPAPAANHGATTKFNLASFNVLGASHTTASGTKPRRASGAARMSGLIKHLDKHDVDVVGFQELQDSQIKQFKAANTGFELESQQDNSIAWKSDKFRKISSTTMKIPYFEGEIREMPVVQLEDKATGKRAWFISIHNPADTTYHHNQGAYRAEALKLEKAFIDKLHKTGLPVFMVGDFNDRAQANAAITGGGDMKASKPASVKAGIDWVFGSSSVKFSKGVTDRSTVKDGISDHPMVVTTAKI